MPQHLFNRRQCGFFSILSETAAGSSDSTDNVDLGTIAEEVFARDKRPVILFDGVCNLCNGGVNFALDNDSIGG